MPRNNSHKRKDERKERDDERNRAMHYRDCGHWHTDNGYQFCQEWRPVQRYGIAQS